MGIFNFLSKKEEIVEPYDYVHLFDSQKEDVMKLVEITIEDSFSKATANQAKILKVSKNLDDLQVQLREAKDNLAQVKKDHELEKQEMEHLVALKNERTEVELQKKGLDLEKEYHAKEMVLTKSHFKDVLSTIDKYQKDAKELHTQLLKAVNVNVDITKEAS